MRRFGTSVAAMTAAALAVATASGCDGGARSTAPSMSAPSDSGKTQTDPPTSGADVPDDLVARGELIYNVNCIACHHRDPAQDGGLGPPIAGASFELLEARVLRAEYPPGYEPKADTRLMIPLPHLEPEIKALAAFLAPK